MRCMLSVATRSMRGEESRPHELMRPSLANDLRIGDGEPVEKLVGMREGVPQVAPTLTPALSRRREREKTLFDEEYGS